MSRLLTPPLPPTPPQEGQKPFYGWRYLHRYDADGREYLEEVPLTLEDVLYPQEGDEIPMRPQHQIECAYLANVLRARYADDSTVAVLSDCLIDWGVDEQRNHQPDICVFRDVLIPPDPKQGTFPLIPSGGRTVLVAEVVSPDTRVNDVVRKPVDYHRLGIPLYVLIDQQREEGSRRLHGYLWTPSGYEDSPLDAHGRLLLEPVGLQLALEDGWLVCYDVATGERLGDYREERAARQVAEQRQRQETEARQIAEQRQRQETEARQAAEQRQRQEAEARQAAERGQQQEAEARQAAERGQQQEAKARQAAEQRQRQEAEARQAAEDRAREAEERLRQLEQELRRLRGQP